MEIRFREAEKNTIADYVLISKWNNDAAIKHLIMPNFSEGAMPDSTPEELFNSALKQTGMYHYLIMADGIAVGEISIQIDPPQLHKKVKNTGWIGITIGEEKFRGKGIGKTAIEFLENKCRELKLARIELGVFAFNHNAIKFYKSMDYKEFAVLNNFTYYQGEWHDDIRMEKYL